MYACMNQQVVQECKGRVVGAYPVYLPSVLSQRVIILAYKGALQDIDKGLTMTMTQVGSTYWIPTLRRLVKSVLTNCYACVKFKVMFYSYPKPGPTRGTFLSK